jgi:hypothetical protein
MKDWKRIFLVVSLLIGATLTFGNWSLNRFNDVFDSIMATPVVITIPVSSRLQEVETSTSTTMITASSTNATSTATSTASSTTQLVLNDLDTNFELIFSPAKGAVYVGCTYEISWTASTTINSLSTALIDAGTGKPTGPIASRLAKENIIAVPSQNLKWKVGVVWPGEYYISISSVNGVDFDTKSKKFLIMEIPSGLAVEAKNNLCEETGGVLI